MEKEREKKEGKEERGKKREEKISLSPFRTHACARKRRKRENGRGIFLPPLLATEFPSRERERGEEEKWRKRERRERASYLVTIL